MMFRLEPRRRSSPVMVYAAPLLAVALTLLAGVVLFAILGHDPLVALHAYFVEPLSTLYGVAELGVKATPLALIAIGLAIGFRANVWNIGAEGQLTIGAIAGAAVALYLGPSMGAFGIPLMLLAGALGGIAWAAVPAFLKTRFNASEILTSLMLTYVAQLLLNYMVTGPMRDPDGFNFPQSPMLDAALMLPALLPDTRLHAGWLIALFALAAGWVLLSRTFLGFQIKVVGLTPAAAGYAGFNARKLTWLTLLLSGGLAGLAGTIEVAGPVGQLVPAISPGYGFTAIIVAFLGRLHPVGILLAALVVALSFIGGESAQITLRLPVAVTGVFQGLLLFFLLACDLLIRYRIRLGSPKGAH